MLISNTNALQKKIVSLISSLTVEEKKIQLGGVILTFLQVASHGIVALACAALVRLVGEEAVGVFTLAKVMPSLLAAGLTAGTPGIFPYLLNQPQWNPGKLWGFSLLWVSVVGGLSALIWVVMSNFLAVKLFHNSVGVAVVRLLGLMLPITLMWSFTHAILQAMRRYRYYIICYVMEILLYGLAGIFSSFWFRSTNGLALAIIVSTGIGVLFPYMFVLRVVRKPIFAIKFRSITEAIALGLKGYLGALASLLNYRLDVVLLSFLTDVKSVGIYSIITKIAEVGQYFTVSVSNMLTPYAAQRQTREAWLLSRRVFWRTFLTSLCILVLMATLAPWILPLFGPGVAMGLVAFYLILLGMLFLSGKGPILSYFIAIGKPQYYTYATFVGLVFTAVLDILLIPVWGINGAGFASMCSYSVVGIVLVAIFFRKGPSTPTAEALFLKEVTNTSGRTKVNVRNDQIK